MDQKTAKLILAQNKQTYNTIAKNFSNTRNRPWPELDFFVNKYIKNEFNILDIGCGNGRLLDILFDRDVEYTGIDASSGLIHEAKNHYHYNKNAIFKVGDILKLRSQNEYDAIFCIAALNHIPTVSLRNKAIQNIYNALKPNGYFFMTNWNLWNTANKKNWWRLKFQKSYKKLSIDWNDIFTYWGKKKLPLFYHAFTLSETEKLLKKNRFKILKNYYSFGSEKTSALKAKNILTIGQK